MAIITISRQIGSRGTEIARLLEEELSYNVLGKGTIDPMLMHQGIELTDKYDEKKPGFWETFSAENCMYIHALQTVIYEHALRDNCIILGRGGQFLLRNIPGTLKVNIVAPVSLRIRRIQEQYRLDRHQAETMLHSSDRDRKEFHRFFFDIDWESSGLYDMVLNTETFSSRHAAACIREGLQACETAERKEKTARMLADFCLGQKIIQNILAAKKMPMPYLRADVEDGVVTLSGGVLNRPDFDICEHAARQVPGVKQVINRANFINPWGIA